jgi:hypothetical protein
MAESTLILPTESFLETKCGWKGVLKSIRTNVHHHPWNSPPQEPDDYAPSKEGHSDHTVLSLESSSSTEFTIPDEAWMGGEPALKDETVERKGVMTILSALTEAERAQIEGFDRTMPIRHFRAEKVR